jgi:hypothetical protein
VIRIDAAGEILWDQTYGSPDQEHAYSIAVLPDGSFYLGGQSAGGGGGTRTAQGFGSWDLWLVKCDSEGRQIWDRTLGGSREDYGWGGVAVTDDGGVVIAGTTPSDRGTGNLGPDAYGDWDGLMARYSPVGDLLWQRRIGGGGTDHLWTMKIRKGQEAGTTG